MDQYIKIIHYIGIYIKLYIYSYIYINQDSYTNQSIIICQSHGSSRLGLDKGRWNPNSGQKFLAVP